MCIDTIKEKTSNGNQIRIRLSKDYPYRLYICVNIYILNIIMYSLKATKRRGAPGYPFSRTGLRNSCQTVRHLRRKWYIILAPSFFQDQQSLHRMLLVVHVFSWVVGDVRSKWWTRAKNITFYTRIPCSLPFWHLCVWNKTATTPYKRNPANKLLK